MPPDTALDLRADCSRCAGLCCVALPFARSADFPEDKAAGSPCRHLAADDRCTVHDRLRPLGYVGCTVFDCFGAGQLVTGRFAGRSWRDDPASAAPQFAAFAVARGIAELRWYLTEVLDTPSAAPVHAEAAARDDDARRLLAGSLDEADAARLREVAADVVREAARLVRDATPGPGSRHRSRPGADLVGASLAGADLRASDLRGALLLGADLTGADLAGATLLGADLRGARIAGARLAGAFGVTTPQVAAAHGDGTTTLPARVLRPSHWD